MRRPGYRTVMACLVGATLLGCCTIGPPPQTFAELPNDFVTPLTAAFDRQARGLDDAQWKTLYAKHVANSKVPVNIALIDVDTGPNATVVQSVHSSAITRVMGRLFCESPGAPGCRIQSNVTPLTSNDGMAGGTRGVGTPYFMTFDQLTNALRGVLDRKKPEEHLIINLGVAWDPIKTDPDEGNIKPIVDQLVRASCIGAIVVAPAGNATGSTGAMFPAIFESQQAPSAEDCAKAGFPQSHQASGGYAPLVYAVGAVDARDRRLETMRPSGEPRITALGLGVSASGPQNMPFSQPLSGTSMSTAIVSGIAASVWAVRPELNGHQIMDLVYQGGLALDDGFKSGGARTDFCVGQPFGPCLEWIVRRANLCGALAKALPDEKLLCNGAAFSPVNLPSKPPFIPTVTAQAKTPCRVTGCGVTSESLAIQKVEGAVPQPPDPICPTCTLTSHSMFGAVVWPAGAPPSMISATVLTYSSGRSTTPTATIPVIPWTPTDAVFTVNMGPPAGTRAATLTVVDAEGAHVIPLIVP